MTHKITAAIFAIMIGSTTYADASFGSAQEAEAMLQRAVVAMETDSAAALAAFTAGADGFQDRDLYVACFEDDVDGVITAHGAAAQYVGVPIVQLVDKNGTIIIGQILPFSVEGEIKPATYWWPRPSEEEPTKKVMLHTKVAGHICGVGHYE